MTIKEMHIGIDLGVQRLNSNVFGKLLPEEKDYFINITTQEFVKLALTNERNTLFTPQTYADIRKYYEVLQSYILTRQLGLVEELGSGYVYGKLPSGITISALVSGLLYHGVSYKVIVAGGTDLSNYGYLASPVEGDTFECNITTQTGGNITLVTGESYRIVNAANGDFTSYGAANNNPGTEFTATSSTSVTGTASTVVQNLSKTPSWDSTTKLIPISDVGYYMNIATRSSIAYGNPITSGALTKGKKYIVKVKGTTSDLDTYGGVAAPDVNYIFTCSTTGTPTWAGGTELYEIKDVGNRLIKAQDVDDFLANSFGSTINSPISIFANNRLRVYTDNKFNVERLFLDYIRKPISVSLSDSIDSDLPESAQPFLISLVIEKIAALSGNPTYNAIDKENSETENNIN